MSPFRNILPTARDECPVPTFIAPGGEERDRIYARWVEQYPQFRAYQEKTTRIIPVIELELPRA